jgi:hypothetical protein
MIQFKKFNFFKIFKSKYRAFYKIGRFNIELSSNGFKRLKKKPLKKAFKKNKPYIVTHWHATLNMIVKL